MPRAVVEISSGNQVSRTMDQSGVADTATRVFRVVLNEPGEAFDIQSECGVFIGSQHPVNTNVYCRSLSAGFEGASRMAMLCTFQYQSTPGADPQDDPGQYSPDVRPANWSISSSIIETPIRKWRVGDAGDFVPAVNPAGDMYDGITGFQPVTTISIEQWQGTPNLHHTQHVGKVNDKAFKVGTFNFPSRTVMFRGMSSRPAVESFGQTLYRGWQAVYEFMYKPNYFDGQQIGWDIMVPLSGFNCYAFAPGGGGGGDRDVFGQPLRHGDEEEYPKYIGRIITPDGGGYLLPKGINAGEKVRAMVRVHEYESGGASQTPSAMPIPLNEDGTPRASTADPKVILKRYQVTVEHDFYSFNLRLT